MLSACGLRVAAMLRQKGIGVSLSGLPAQKLPADGAVFLLHYAAKEKWFDI